MLKMPGILPVQGGVPIMVDGTCVGAVGVSGVQSHEDEQIAQAGIDALLQALVEYSGIGYRFACVRFMNPREGSKT